MAGQSSRQKKKSIERFHLLRFSESLSDFPEGELSFGDKPDLVVQTNDGPLGIEHTQIFREKDTDSILTLKAQESLQQRIVDQAWEIYKDSGGPALSVHVAFEDQMEFKKKDVRSIAVSLVTVIHAALYKFPHVRPLERWWYDRKIPGQFPAEVKLIWWDIVSDPKLALWGVARSTIVPRLTTEQLQGEIDKKEEKLDAYRSRCTNVWLTIVADGSSPASYFDMPPEVSEHTFKSQFERVFYFESFRDEVTELRVVQESASRPMENL